MLHSLDLPTTVFLYTFIIGAILAVIYVLFGDALDALFGISPGSIISPTVVLCFITVFSCVGYILKDATDLSTGMVCIISFVGTFILVSLLYVFLLAPVSKAEQNTAYSLKDLVGGVGKLTVSIPENGFGQISIESKFGYQSYAANSIDGSAIPSGTEVRIVKIEKSVFFVEAYECSLKTK